MICIKFHVFSEIILQPNIVTILGHIDEIKFGACENLVIQVLLFVRTKQKFKFL